jgi:hypothetical protein
MNTEADLGRNQKGGLACQGLETGVCSWHSASKRIPSPLSGPGSEVKEKCCREQNIGKDQSGHQEEAPELKHSLKDNASPSFWFYASEVLIIINNSLMH